MVSLTSHRRIPHLFSLSNDGLCSVYDLVPVLLQPCLLFVLHCGQHIINAVGKSDAWQSNKVNTFS